MVEPVAIFAGDLLRADLFNPDGKQLFVSFRHRVLQDGAFDAPRATRSFVDAGYAHLHIQTRFNDWYINAETPAFEAALAAATQGFARRVAMGFSMGGYGALRFSTTLDLRHVILVTPQFSIHPEVVPFDKRFRDSSAGFDAEQGDLMLHGRRQLAGVILADPFRPMDMYNARLIQVYFKRLAVARACCAGHQAAKVLNMAGHFGAFQRALKSVPVQARTVIDLHRDGRRTSSAYWSALSTLAQTHGHATLAETARQRAADLEAAD